MRDEQEGPGRPVALSGQSGTFDKLRELTRHGYVPDPAPARSTTGILLRHSSAPDLILHADGRIELPPVQREKKVATEPKAAPRDGISWRRTIFVTVVVAGLWLLSVLFGLFILSGMVG
jgi:hypothetical protein